MFYKFRNKLYVACGVALLCNAIPNKILRFVRGTRSRDRHAYRMHDNHCYFRLCGEGNAVLNPKSQRHGGCCGWFWLFCHDVQRSRRDCILCDGRGVLHVPAKRVQCGVLPAHPTDKRRKSSATTNRHCSYSTLKPREVRTPRCFQVVAYSQHQIGTHINL